MRVLVVGAGPTGLSAALELRRRGIEADIVDRRANASNLSRAVGILPASLDLLASSGAASGLLAEGVRYDGLRAHVGSRLIADLRFADAGEAFLLGLPQDRTEAILADRLAAFGGTVRFGREVTGLVQDGDAVNVAFAGGTTERYDHVLGADGVRSAVRAAMGVPFEGHDLPDAWGVADVGARGWAYPGAFSLFLVDGGIVVVVAPIGADRYRVIANRPDPLRHLPLPLAITARHGEGEFHIAVRQVPRYSVGRVHVAGDAAHCHSPVGGRGMNLGIADACDFAARLAEGTLDGYSAARHADGAATIRLSEAVRKQIDGKGERRLVRAVAWIADRVAPVERFLVRRALGL